MIHTTQTYTPNTPTTHTSVKTYFKNVVTAGALSLTSILGMPTTLPAQTLPAQTLPAQEVTTVPSTEIQYVHPITEHEKYIAYVIAYLLSPGVKTQIPELETLMQDAINKAAYTRPLDFIAHDQNGKEYFVQVSTPTLEGNILTYTMQELRETADKKMVPPQKVMYQLSEIEMAMISDAKAPVSPGGLGINGPKIRKDYEEEGHGLLGKKNSGGIFRNALLYDKFTKGKALPWSTIFNSIKPQEQELQINMYISCYESFFNALENTKTPDGKTLWNDFLWAPQEQDLTSSFPPILTAVMPEVTKNLRFLESYLGIDNKEMAKTFKKIIETSHPSREEIRAKIRTYLLEDCVKVLAKDFATVFTYYESTDRWDEIESDPTFRHYPESLVRNRLYRASLTLDIDLPGLFKTVAQHRGERHDMEKNFQTVVMNYFTGKQLTVENLTKGLFIPKALSAYLQDQVENLPVRAVHAIRVAQTGTLVDLIHEPLQVEENYRKLLQQKKPITIITPAAYAQLEKDNENHAKQVMEIMDTYNELVKKEQQAENEESGGFFSAFFGSLIGAAVCLIPGAQPIGAAIIYSSLAAGAVQSGTGIYDAANCKSSADYLKTNRDRVHLPADVILSEKNINDLQINSVKINHVYYVSKDPKIVNTLESKVGFDITMNATAAGRTFTMNYFQTSDLSRQELFIDGKNVITCGKLEQQFPHLMESMGINPFVAHETIQKRLTAFTQFLKLVSVFEQQGREEHVSPSINKGFGLTEKRQGDPKVITAVQEAFPKQNLNMEYEPTGTFEQELKNTFQNWRKGLPPREAEFRFGINFAGPL